MTMTMTPCLFLSLRGHGPHASYELAGQCLLKANDLLRKILLVMHIAQPAVEANRPLSVFLAL